MTFEDVGNLAKILQELNKSCVKQCITKSK